MLLKSLSTRGTMAVAGVACNIYIYAYYLILIFNVKMMQKAFN